jgi:hypothetical protein
MFCIIINPILVQEDMQYMKDNPDIVERIRLLQKYYDIDYSKLGKKSPEKRTVPIDKTFEFPYGLKIAQLRESVFSGLTVTKDLLLKPHNSRIENNIVSNKLPVYLEIDLKDEKDESGKWRVRIKMAYSPSLEMCRYELFGEMVGCTRQVELIAKTTVLSKEKIGDDLCFIAPFHNDEIYFIRQNTFFLIRLENYKDKEINIIELAKYIDQKFVELNKKLNEKEETGNDQ